jgi:hypothetical protein
VKDDRLYIDRVLDCVRRIDRYCQNGEEAFRGSELIQDAVLRNLQTIAESTQRISDSLLGEDSPVGHRTVTACDTYRAGRYRSFTAVVGSSSSRDRRWPLVTRASVR